MDPHDPLDFLEEDTPYIIAEVGGNHGGDVEEAKRYIRAAAECGVHAVKFQLYDADSLIVRDEPPLPQVADRYSSQHERFRELELEMEEWRECVALADELDVDFAASAFDAEMVDFVAEVSPFIKIASGDLTHLPLLRHAAERTDAPIVLSTGCSTMQEISRVVDELPRDRLVLLHCVTAYPTQESDANLQLIRRLRDTFGTTVGYSDHTAGIRAASAAVAMGARVIEKHFTLEAAAESGDHSLSGTPAEFRTLVSEAERIAALSTSADRSQPLSAETACEAARRSLAAATDIDEGERIDRSKLVALRPERGISPLDVDDVVGKTATRQIDSNTILTWDDLR